jgi:hypothetical protein
VITSRIMHESDRMEHISFGSLMRDNGEPDVDMRGPSHMSEPNIRIEGKHEVLCMGVGVRFAYGGLEHELELRSWEVGGIEQCGWFETGSEVRSEIRSESRSGVRSAVVGPGLGPGRG